MVQEIPICCHRQYIKGHTENIVCHSPKFVGGRNVTTLSFCKEKCHCPNKSCDKDTVVVSPTIRKQEKRVCIHLGEETGEVEQCQSCRGRVMVKIYSCSVYERGCTLTKAIPSRACCNGTRGEDGFHTPCPHYKTEGEKDDPVVDTQVEQSLVVDNRKTSSNRKKLTWAYGITTTPMRMENGILDRTIASLSQAGFPHPRLFIDGGEDQLGYKNIYYGHEITCHHPPLRTHGNWVLSLYELYIRQPLMNRYAIFQDDFVTYPNLRDYLDSCTYPEKGYWNLYTFPVNQKLFPRDSQGRQIPGWYPSNQRGLGAVALVFDREAVITLLSAKPLVERVMHKKRGHKSVDGGIVHAMRKQGYREYVHNPSIVQHTGEKSSMGNKKQPLAESFMGEKFDARSLIPHTTTLSSV